VWDSRSRTSKHFCSQQSYQDFTAVRHADDTILISGVSSLRTSRCITTKHYNSQGTLVSSQSISPPNHPFNTYKLRNEFSKFLLSDTSDDSIAFAHYRFSCTKQKMTNANVEYNATTRALTCSSRRSQLPIPDIDSKDKVKYLRLHGCTIHLQDVISIAYKEGSLPKTQGGVGFCFDLGAFYSWQDAQTLTYTGAEIDSIIMAIWGEPDHEERYRPRKPVNCFSDDTFLVKCFEDSFEVYCFDKDLSLATSCESYRKERDRRAKERSKQRKSKARRIAQSYTFMKATACFTDLRPNLHYL